MAVDRWRLRQNRLWILAALLGLATLHSFFWIIHDTSQRHIAASLVRKATADRIAAYASDRATTLALETFAPVSTPTGASSRAEIAVLVRHQAEAVRCACRDTLPVAGFVRYDVATGDLIGPVDLKDVMSRDARATRRPAIHLTVGGDAGLITYVQYDGASRPRAVFGLVAPAAAIGNALFADAARATAVVDSGQRLVDLDSVSLLVVGPDSTHLFGAIGMNRFAAATNASGALEGVRVWVALGGPQIHWSLHALVPTRQLWHNGALILATTVVMIFAVGSARREALLARARSDFVAGVSHDLRMPLAQLLLAGETMVKHPNTPPEERRGLAKAIVRESRRLITLVENLLLFSRTGAVELKANVEPVRVDELFAGVVEAVELAADDARQSIAVGASPAIVLADERLLRQALVNLVDNALKYGKPGQRIRLTAETLPNRRVRLCVDDEGPGIPPREREHVFQPYERLGRDQTSERTGTGLGLVVVRQIAQACGGRVWLEDSPAGGTRAIIELGAADAPAPASCATEPV